MTSASRVFPLICLCACCQGPSNAQDVGLFASLPGLVAEMAVPVEGTYHWDEDTFCEVDGPANITQTDETVPRRIHPLRADVEWSSTPRVFDKTLRLLYGPELGEAEDFDQNDREGFFRLDLFDLAISLPEHEAELAARPATVVCDGDVIERGYLMVNARERVFDQQHLDFYGLSRADARAELEELVEGPPVPAGYEFFECPCRTTYANAE